MASLKDVICTGVIRCLSNVYASKFIGNLQGTADKAKTLDGMTSSVTELNYVKGTTSSVQTQINDLKKSVSDGKTLVANAITGKGIETATDATFVTIADNISKIETGVDTSDGTATSDMIAYGQTAYVNGQKVIGTLGVRGITDDLSVSRGPDLSYEGGNLAGASVGDYALFAGGHKTVSDTNIPLSNVCAYNSSLTKSTPTELSVARLNLAGASVGDYALFAGGASDASKTTGIHTTVDAYNSSLVRTIPTELSYKRQNTVGGTVGNYALFAGGSFTDNRVKVVDAYNSSLVRTIPTQLAVGRYYFASASVGDYVIFAGGQDNNSLDAIDAYNSSLVRSQPAYLSNQPWGNAGASVNNEYAIFAGGVNSITEAYNSSLIKSTLTSLDKNSLYMIGASTENYAIFAGGGGYGTNLKTFNAYNKLLTKLSRSLTVGRYSCGDRSSAVIGNYVIFAGGSVDSSVDTSYVDICNISGQPIITIPETIIYL